MSLASDSSETVDWALSNNYLSIYLSSETVEVIIVKFGMVTVSDMSMHHVFIIFTFTFIQGHTDLNHENNNVLIISETIQAMPIMIVVKVVRLKFYVTIASPMTLAFIQGHKCVSNLTTF